MCKAITPPKKVFIVGGFDSMVWGNFQRHLNENGIEIGGHYEKGDVLRAIPADCDGLIIMYDMTSHALMNKAIELADARAIPYVRCPRKWSIALTNLIQTGFLPEPVVSAPALPAAPVVAPDPKKDSQCLTPFGLALEILALDPELLLKPNHLLDAMIDSALKKTGVAGVVPVAGNATKEFLVAMSKLMGGPVDPGQVDQGLITAITYTKKKWADRANAADRIVVVKVWLKNWFNKFLTGEAPFPTFEPYRAKGKELFGVALRWEYAKEVRAELFGPWAEELCPVGKLVDKFKQQHPEDNLLALLKSNQIKGVQTAAGWQTSQMAIEEWQALSKTTAPTTDIAEVVQPDVQPDVHHKHSVPPLEPVLAPPAPVFDVAALQEIISKAVKEAVLPLEEQVILLQLQVEVLQGKIASINNPLGFKLSGLNLTLEPITSPTPT